MKHIVGYFIKHPIAANLLMFLILIFGGFGLYSLKSTFFPERESKIININVAYPGASPEEMEEGIVLKIEDNLRGITGIERVSSVSRENSASVTVEVEDDYNTDFVLQDVKNAVDRIPSFPAGMEPPEIFKRESLNFAISFALSGENVDLKRLKEEARDIEDELRGVEGISKVSISGYPPEEIEISLREEDLRAYELTFRDISQAVRNANLETTGGTIEGETEEMLIRARSKEYYAEEFKNIVVKSKSGGRVVRLKDVANVKDRWADSPNRTFLNGKRSVVVTIQNTIYQDILFITDYIKDYVKEFNHQNNEVQATIIRDGSDNLRQRIDLLVNNGLIGFGLVLILLSMFLNIRLAFWVAIAIPISFAGMFIIASFYGLTINVISLFGMILVIGILVDDGIIFGENIYQHFERGERPVPAAVNGTMEVLAPVTSGILTTVVAFSTFFFLGGNIGDFITDMAFVVIMTLIFSLIEGVLILPSHVAHSKALQGNPQDKKSWINRQTENLMNYLRAKLYAPVLRFSIEHKFITLSIAIGLFIITIGALRGGIVQTTFFPNIERDNIDITLEMPSGTNEEITLKWLRHIQDAIWRVNEDLKAQRVDNRDVIDKVQLQLGPNIHTGNLEVSLLSAEYRTKPAYEITNLIREETGTIPEAEKISFGGGTPFGKPVSVALLGNDYEQLEGAKEELKSELNNLSSVKDVVDNDQIGLREVNITLKDKAYLLGLNLQQVMSQVRDGFFGNEVQRLQRGLDEVRVWVRFNEQNRENLSQLENMRIRVPGEGAYPLQEIATFEIERGILAINHLYGKREILVEADMADPTGSATEIMEEIRNEILPPILAKYQDITVSYEGQSRESQETTGSAGRILPVIMILMFALIVLTFRSMMQTVIIFLILPFGFIGVAGGHLIHGMPISILSMYGIIALIGIMVNDSLVLVSAMNNYLKRGDDFYTAVYNAGLTRFRPILLTSLTTIAGLGPLILDNSFQAQFLIPMAVSVAYGMISATFITLIVLPILLVYLNRLKTHWMWLWNGKKPSPEEVEPAVKELREETAGDY